jgi:hypothetical protein
MELNSNAMPVRKDRYQAGRGQNPALIPDIAANAANKPLRRARQMCAKIALCQLKRSTKKINCGLRYNH